MRALGSLWREGDRHHTGRLNQQAVSAGRFLTLGGWPLWSFLACSMLSSQVPVDAADKLTFERDGKTYERNGDVLLEAQDGGLLFLADDNVLWDVQPDQLRQRSSTPEPLVFLDARALEARVLEELPEGFRVHRTRNYLVFYDTNRAYAEWCGALFERLRRTFHTYWDRRGVEIKPASTVLVAIVFGSQSSYQEYASRELGKATGSVIGYYSLHTNRMAMYDLTGVSLAARGRRVRSAALANQLFSTPKAERTVATIVHEATHQMAFNCGMQVRYADIPVWLSEGLAMYFEVPDLQNRRGWSTHGGLNLVRGTQFQRYLAERPADSLYSLIRDDHRFRELQRSQDAYAEAWVLCHYLIKRRPKEFVKYIRSLAEKKPSQKATPAERVDEFREFFGDDVDQLDSEMVEYFKRLRR